VSTAKPTWLALTGPARTIPQLATVRVSIEDLAWFSDVAAQHQLRGPEHAPRRLAVGIRHIGVVDRAARPHRVPRVAGHAVAHVHPTVVEGQLLGQRAQPGQVLGRDPRLACGYLF
jgi:hypothetical protein